MNTTQETTETTIDELSEIYDKNPYENYETISYEDPKQVDLIVDIIKENDWDIEVTKIIKNITHSENIHKYYDDYPYYKPITDDLITQKMNSDILNEEQEKEIHTILPYYLRYVKSNLLYRMTIDGCSFNTFYHKAEGYNNTLLIIKDERGNIFGGYNCEEYSKEHKGFFGRGENFLYTFYNENRVHVFYATGDNDNYVYCDNDNIAFGCSGDSFGLCLKKDFEKGYSKEVDTFENSILNGSTEGFYIIDVELWELGN